MEATIKFDGDCGYIVQVGTEFAHCLDVWGQLNKERLTEYFEEWKQAALDGEEGYEYWTA